LKLIGVIVLLFALMTACFALKDRSEENAATEDDGSQTIPVTKGVEDDSFTIKPEGRIFTDHGETFLTIPALRSESETSNRAPQLTVEVTYEGLDDPWTCEMDRSYLWSSFTEWDEIQVPCGAMGYEDAVSAVIVGS
jgi:hypothetical protein